jgi:voltage-gated potassium channel
MSSKVTFMIMRRMRTPLLVLLFVYTVAILGLTLVQGVDDQGRPWTMSFFHAFYVVSYTATTIGFGEIPYTFSEAQRLWVSVTLYLTVIAWIYAIGVLLNLIQNQAFQRVVVANRFARMVKRIHEPFYLICGFGDTGKALVRALTDRGMRAVVLDANDDDIQFMGLQNFTIDVPGLCADCSVPHNLIKGGLKHPHIKGIVALTNREAVNLKIAITSKLLNPDLPVICRGETQQYEDNMASFGTDHIIDPFTIFADQIALALRKPGIFLLYNWLTGVPDSRIPEPIFPPEGIWILCGYGRFGKAMHTKLSESGVNVVTIENDPQNTQCPPDSIIGWGTEACTLQEAGIESAVGLVAGTEIDANNLSIVMTAQQLNPNLFVVIRQNRRTNRGLFQSIHSDLVMEPSEIVAREVRVLLTMPLLPLFLSEAYKQEKDWANRVATHIIAIIGDTLPEVWSVEITAKSSPACITAMNKGINIPINLLITNPRDRNKKLKCMPLMRIRHNKTELTPGVDEMLEPGDSLLFCGQHGVASLMAWSLNNEKALNYLLTGDETPDGYLWSWLLKKKNN